MPPSFVASSDVTCIDYVYDRDLNDDEQDPNDFICISEGAIGVRACEAQASITKLQADRQTVRLCVHDTILDLLSELLEGPGIAATSSALTASPRASIAIFQNELLRANLSTAQRLLQA